MMLYLRLLAGFTSFISNLCLSHEVSIGPAGTLPSSCIRSCLSGMRHAGFRRNHVHHGGDWNRKIAGRNEDSEHGGGPLEARRVARMTDAERLEHAPQPVIEVHA